MDIPKGFQFAAVAAGLKYKDRTDLALIASTQPAVSAGVFTRNLFKAAPVLHCMSTLRGAETAQAFLINAGMANACTGQQGLDNCKRTLELVAENSDIESFRILPASTGVIGMQYNMEPWKKGVPELCAKLGESTPEDVAKAMMTTDSMHKLAGSTFEASGGEVRVMGMCKGAGMISPDMATMLGFIICDARVNVQVWREIIKECADKSFNRVTVDGDTSTNDCVMGLANGASGVRIESDDDIELLKGHVQAVCAELAYMIVKDAEGGTKVARIVVTGASDDHQANLVARAVGNSPLVKTALFGCDPNWGRIVAAAGRSNAWFDADQLVLSIGEHVVFEKGQPVLEDIDEVLGPIMKERDVRVGIKLGNGSGRCTLLASDLTHDYISINADYRS